MVDDVFATGLDDAATDLESHLAIAGVIHAGAIVLEIGDGIPDGLVSGMALQRTEKRVQFPCPQLVQAMLCPPFVYVAVFSVDGMGNIPDVGASPV